MKVILTVKLYVMVKVPTFLVFLLTPELSNEGEIRPFLNMG